MSEELGPGIQYALDQLDGSDFESVRAHARTLREALSTTPAAPKVTDAMGHDEAIDALVSCAQTVTVLSYREVIEGYFKLRGMGAALPASENTAPDDHISDARKMVEAPDGERVSGVDWRKLAINLAMREADYRLNHDVHGGGEMVTGRSWDKMRGSGDAIREAALQPTAAEAPTKREIEDAALERCMEAAKKHIYSEDFGLDAEMCAVNSAILDVVDEFRALKSGGTA